MKIKKFSLTPEFIIELALEGNNLSKPNVWVSEGLPPDAELHRIYFDRITNIVWCIVGSKRFKDLPEGAEIPQINITYKRSRWS